ncbi:MAG: squalene--hopene cyclase [Dehalococcoidales bacterium]|nr:squalene--hopene cyclase [Dehalococcoidales bacterium]
MSMIRDTVSTIDSRDQIRLLDEAIQRTRDYLLKIQNPDGYWVGELEADASVAAGYIPLMYFMTGKVDAEKKAKVVNYVRSRQNQDGSWSAYYGGPGDLNVSIQVYFALKLAGIPASEGFMQKARDFILSRGGVMKANTITRIWLAVFGQFDYRGTPSIPPELVFLPDWFYFNIYEFASWSRETIMALMIVLSTRPVCQVPDASGIEELYLEPVGRRHFKPAEWGKPFSWKSFFLSADYFLKAMEKLHLKPFRRIALKKVERWVVEHQEKDGSWGGIMLPWVYSLIALKSLGYGLDHPVIKKGMEGLQVFIIEDEQTLRLQPAVSPVWDTAWSLLALRQSGLPADHPAIQKGARWLLQKEIRVAGDWRIKNPATPPGCWSFEFCNDFYPDIDDTSVVCRLLLNINLGIESEKSVREAVQRGCNWIKAMQSKDGGWAAFDRDNNRQILANVPYADFMTPLDPTSADVTAHVIELLSAFEGRTPAVERSIEYLKRTQESDGCWYGRWGVNYIYGTGQVLAGLKAARENMAQKYIYRAVDWLIAHQNSDGGWGETCETYTDPWMRGKGVSTASQTAWALLGLISAGKYEDQAVARGIAYLLERQTADGTWTEEQYTGTGFPRAFYLRYDLYRIYFPLLVLSQYRASLEAKNG